MDIKTFDGATHKMIDICKNTKDQHFKYVKVYILLREMYNLGKMKHNKLLQPTQKE